MSKYFEIIAKFNHLVITRREGIHKALLLASRMLFVESSDFFFEIVNAFKGGWWETASSLEARRAIS